MSAPAKEAARKAESSTAFEWTARAGYAANGVVHLLIAGIVLAVAFGADGETDQAGAFKAIAAVPLGFVALWVLAVALWALGLWHVLEGILARDRSDDIAGAAKKWGRRTAEWGQGVIFIALGLISAAVALGAKPNAEDTVENISGGVIDLFAGVWVLGLTGLGVGIGGIAFIVMGFLRSFKNRVSIPSGVLGTFITGLGVVGFIAKGVALAIVGILLLVAAVKVEPATAGGLDGATQALLRLPYGPLLVGAVGVGFVAYGLFCFFRARYAKL